MFNDIQFMINIVFYLFQKLLDVIKTQAAKLASLNAVVHRFTLENQDFDDFSKCTLKAEVSELYELFDNARTR